MIDIAGKRVALYARHSSAAQDRSVPAQLVRCREVAHQHSAVIVEEYADEAITGEVLNARPAVQALLAHAANGDFDAVLFEDLSRISRDQADVATIHKLLDFHGVVLVSVTEGKIGPLHIGFSGTMNAMFLDNMKDKVRRGQFAAVRNGSIPGGRLYGYDLVPGEGPGTRTINETEAAVVRRIFEEAAAGRQYTDIARGLTADGIPPFSAAKWTTSTLVGTAARGKGLLRNPIYRGRLYFGRTYNVRNPATGRRETRWRPQSEWEVVEVPHLAIVTPELWDSVQAVLAAKRSARKPYHRSRRASSQPAVSYITSGRLWCADCGGRVTTAHSGYLVCRAWKTSKDCQQRHLFRRPDVIAALGRRLAGAGHARVVHRAVRTEAAARQDLQRRVRRTLAEVEQSLVCLTESAADLAKSADEHPDLRRALYELAIPEDEIDAFLKRVTTTCDTLAIITPRNSLDVAAAAHACIARAAKTLAGAEDHQGPSDQVLREVLDRITVAYRGPDRTRLTVAATLDTAAVYDLGIRELRLEASHGADPAAEGRAA